MAKRSLSFSSSRASYPAWEGFVLLAGASAVVTVACGGSSSDGGNGQDSSDTTPSGGGCAGTTRALCKKACACTSNGAGKCTIAYGTSVTETHDSEAQCETFYAALVCGDAANAAQYDDACGAAVASASCTTTSTGAAVAFPSAGCPKKK